MNNLLIILIFLSLSTSVLAQSAPPATATPPTSVANEVASQNTALATTVPADVANATDTPTQTATDSTDNTTSDTVADTPPPVSPHDPNAPTLAELQSPKESELSKANTELLAKNAELEGRNAELTTQVNVLVNERSGQLYLYGALTVIVSLLIGAFGAWFILNKKKSDW